MCTDIRNEIMEKTPCKTKFSVTLYVAIISIATCSYTYIFMHTPPNHNTRYEYITNKVIPGINVPFSLNLNVCTFLPILNSTEQDTL